MRAPDGPQQNYPTLLKHSQTAYQSLWPHSQILTLTYPFILTLCIHLPLLRQLGTHQNKHPN